MTDLHGFGFALADISLTEEQCNYIAASLPSAADQRAGRRGLLSHPTLLQLIRHKQLGQLLWSMTGRELVAVAASLAIPHPDDLWHQERVVAVRERLDVKGFGPWSTRSGVAYVEPPASVLAQMVVVRVHLDSSTAERPPLEVFAGSHRSGKLSAADIQHLVDTEEPVTPRIEKGSILVMRPLLVHHAATHSPRTPYRVLQIEFAPAEAISPLHWHASVHTHSAA
jgi:hypothetical protein